METIYRKNVINSFKNYNLLLAQTNELIVIIPAYNEELTIGSVIKSIPEVNGRISKTEVIVVNDGVDLLEIMY
ncbi:hypothetical protein J4413_03590 [Candidatus Woesearchaeota archaeon]|nr:hypothetical protein [Candidatus Woesearchaeota archaeon]